MQEEWRPIPEFPGYEVSSHGRVVSRRRREPAVLTPTLNREGGYRVVRLRLDGRQVPVLLHSLVASVFIGPRPEGMEVLHGDGDKYNNCVSNLRYGTRSENMRDLVTHGNHPMARRTHCAKGHPYSSVNTYTKDRKRHCRTCWAMRDRRKTNVVA